ncbi:hypothetical protein L3X38_024915 [Prunus dulcis]|uniref:Uncharacterized protein n=1 Tax=Prunus dulcis TaxID=3755 RepID=A0AAD4W2M6_PRUDU|nr:hypothetical protein L3X38_024915 [Prunus dulcis]
MLQVMAKRAKESTARAKNPSVARNKLSVKLVDHVFHVGDLDTLSSLSLDKQENALAQNREKLLVKFDTHVEATKTSKYVITANAYKLEYLDCRNGASPCRPIEDKDAKQLYLDLPLAQSEQINVVDVEAVEEHMVDEAAVEGWRS